MSGDGAAPLGPAAADFLRNYALYIPQPHKDFLALRSGAHLTEGSALGECMDEGLLPEETLHVLGAASLLRRVELPPDQWRDLRTVLWGALHVLKGDWDGMSPAVLRVRDDPDRDAFKRVDFRLEEYQQLAEAGLRTVEAAGYRWDWETGRLASEPGPQGGSPRSLLRILVRALLEYRLRHGLPAEQSADVREWIVEELAPILPADLLSTRKDTPLYNAVKKALG